MCSCRLLFRLTRVPSFLLLLLHLFGGSTWNVSRGGGGGGRGGGRDGGAGSGGRSGGGSASGQELPSRDEGYFQFMLKHPEVVVDTRSLPDGKEETVYLEKGKPMRVFFVVEASAALLSLVVTPCSSRISWMFCYLYPTPNEGHDKDQDLEEADEILQQRKASSSSSASVSNGNRNTTRLLKSYIGYDVSGFETGNPDPGVYSIVLVNDDRRGSIRLFASTSPQADSPFPVLPDDPTVRITPSSRSSFQFPFSSTASSSSSGSTIATNDPSKIQLTWRRSPTEEWHRQPVEYCLSINNFRHLKTYCAAKALSFSDPQPTLPPYAGFGAPPNRTRSRSPRHSGRRTPREAKRRTRLICVGSKTSFTFGATPSALVNRRTVYFDVFAVNRRTQSSVTYRGVRLKPVITRRPVQLKLNELRSFPLRTHSDYMLFRFKVPRPPLKSLIFSFRACVSLVRVEISRDDEMVYENRSSEGRPVQFLTKNPSSSSDVYDILVSNDGKSGASFQVIVTQATDMLPFPDIPADVGMRVVQSDCHSLELVWSEPNPGNTRHCLVIEPLHSTGGEIRNRCMIPRSSNNKSKTLCHPPRSSDLRHPFHHNQTVTDLERDSSYRLTIYVRNRNGGQYVAYPPIVGATRKKCRAQSDSN